MVGPDGWPRARGGSDPDGQARRDGQESEGSLAVLVYEAWRFTSATIEQIASALRVAVERAREAIAWVRRRRSLEHAWDPLPWGLEWRLRWKLLTAPWRV